MTEQTLSDGRVVAGGCSAPIRLTGHTDHVDRETGRTRRAYSSAGQPGGVVHVRCNNRRESVCPTCSQTYKRDARRVVLTGLTGGDGLPEGVGAHPALFVTLTAPSFGPVHSRRSRGKGGEARACRPRRGLCPHGRPAGCHAKHGDGDRKLGTPLCADCFDYTGAVIWNTMLPTLWKATRDRLESAVAAASGRSVAAMRRELRVTFAKAAEMQARGLVHLHIVIRIDGRGASPDDVVAPPAWASVDLIADCLRDVLGDVTVPAPHPSNQAGAAVRWGDQVDIRAIGAGGPDDGGRVANYLAKYLTKSVTAGGLLDRPVRSLAHLARLALDPHARRMVETCWQLGADQSFAAALDDAAGRQPGRLPGLIRWSHSYGFGGHWITKSRRYSTTFGALRSARRVYARAMAAALSGGGLPVDAFGRPDGDPRTIILGQWAYAGRGGATTADTVESQTGPPRDRLSSGGSGHAGSPVSCVKVRT